MRIDRKFIAFAIYIVIISVLFSSSSNASNLKLEHLWSSQNAKEWVIGLKAINVREERDKINADVEKMWGQACNIAIQAADHRRQHTDRRDP